MAIIRVNIKYGSESFHLPPPAVNNHCILQLMNLWQILHNAHVAEECVSVASEQLDVVCRQLKDLALPLKDDVGILTDIILVL